MILLFSSTQETNLRIVSFLQTQTKEPIAIAQSHRDIIDLAKKNAPQWIFLHMPSMPGTSRDIQEALRALLPNARVRILPLVLRTDQASGDWQTVVIKALRPRETSGMPKDDLS